MAAREAAYTQGACHPLHVFPIAHWNTPVKQQPFYCTPPDLHGEYDEYFVDHAGAYVRRERIRDLGQAFTLRTDILATNTCFRSLWSTEAEKELGNILAGRG